MERTIKTDYGQDIVLRTQEDMRNIGPQSVNLRWGSSAGTLTSAQALKLAAALVETVAEVTR